MSISSTERVIATDASNPVDGTVFWAAAKSLWISGMTSVAIIGGPMTFSWDAFAIFIVLSALTICAGHSVGMHRLLIHKAFSAPIWVEHILVYLGVLVGMGGPFGVLRIHELRDWAQAQPNCHSFCAHTSSFLQDSFWQMHCDLKLVHPPKIIIEDRLVNDRFYRFLEMTWRFQQMPLAIILFAIGGWPWVVWGICCRVAASLTGHWLVVHFAHQPRDQTFHVKGCGVQGYNLPYFGIVTFGEAFHENHHAFPSSAKLGVMPGQIDPGWWLVRFLDIVGLATDVKTPDTMEFREGLVLIGPPKSSLPTESWVGRVGLAGR
jgi:fatty-acid desaturase